MEYIYIFIFGGIGCLSRYGISGLVHRFAGASFPFGTLTVNFLGSFFLALFIEWSLRTFILSAELRTAIAVGFFGGFTTFSTFSYETVKLIEEGSILLASVNAVTSVLICVTGALGGMLLIRKIL